MKTWQELKKEVWKIDSDRNNRMLADIINKLKTILDEKMRK